MKKRKSLKNNKFVLLSDVFIIRYMVLFPKEKKKRKKKNRPLFNKSTSVNNLEPHFNIKYQGNKGPTPIFFFSNYRL